MCGIAGVWLPGRPRAALATLVEGMARTIVHRGPDHGASFIDAEAGLALAYRRLAVIDTSPDGNQPMVSRCGRYVLVFNGELYNAADLRAAHLAGQPLRGHSDTEVLVEVIARRGVEAALPALNGMYAFALWDRPRRRLTLARDHVGIKPLYWLQTPEGVVFGSELRCLMAAPVWERRIDRAALGAFLRHNYVPAPHTIFAGVRKLEPGQAVTIGPGGATQAFRHWDFDRVAREGLADPLPGGEEAAADALDALLRDAVGRQMVADVPLGAFLSGGIDSSTVAAVMQALSPRPVRTFSIGFHADGYDEAPQARAVARHLGTEHTELYVGEDEALAVVPRLADIFDEPFADSSQIPTFLVAAMTRRHVTVALSGDGGDELFAGYTRYFWGRDYLRAALALPAPVQRLAGRLLRALPAAPIDAAARRAPVRLPALGTRLNRLGAILDEGGFDAMYRRLISHWEPDALAPGAGEAKGVLWDAAVARRIPHPVARMQYFDTLTYLPDDILTKVDRASMAVSLEVRVPLLDPRLVAFAWRLPMALKARGGRGKRLLRRVLHRYVPPALVERPKMGFGAPVGAWLRGPLRDWAEDLLDPAALAADGLDPAPVRALWQAHQAGTVDGQYRLWVVLMLQAWRRRWAEVAPARLAAAL